jgi:hypothetical protein
MEGYLYVHSVAEAVRELWTAPKPDESELSAIRSSIEGRGWVPIEAAIKEGDILKVSATRLNTHYEAWFNMNIPKGDNGACEIRGNQRPYTGIFVKVSQLDDTGFSLALADHFSVLKSVYSNEFRLLFECHSSSGDGRSLLKWWICVKEFVDADNLPAED